MALARILQDYLDQSHVRYRTQAHTPTLSASRTAQVSHVSGEKIAKAVLLRQEDGYTLAVLPATHHLRLEAGNGALGAPVSLASEQEIREIFSDCALGAVPPIGTPYGLDVLVDDSLMELDEIWFEGGDHATLVCVAASGFEKLTEGARHARIAVHD
jgi:Ala-tRNA(Pro) deacylase